MSHPAVHPVEAPPLSIDNGGGGGGGGVVGPRVRMRDYQGMAGTLGGLTLRVFQFLFAIGSLLIMSTTSDFPSVTAFRYLVAAAGLQIIWSLSLAILDIYAILVKRRFRNTRAVSLFAAGDGEKFLDVFSGDAYGCAVDKKSFVGYKHVASAVGKEKRLDFIADFVPEKLVSEAALAETKPAQTSPSLAS